MPDLETLDIATIKKVFTNIGIIPHYKGAPGTKAFNKDLIAIDDLLEGLDVLAGKSKLNEVNPNL